MIPAVVLSCFPIERAGNSASAVADNSSGKVGVGAGSDESGVNVGSVAGVDIGSVVAAVGCVIRLRCGDLLFYIFHVGENKRFFGEISVSDGF